MSKSNSENNEEAEVQELKPDVLKKFVKRIQNVNRQISDLTSDRGHLYLEAKNAGLDTKALKRLITRLKKDPETTAHETAMDNMYGEVFGLQGTPLGDHAAGVPHEAGDDEAESRRKNAIARFSGKKKKGKKAQEAAAA